MTKKKDVRTRAEAKKLMWEYYRDNRASLPKWIGVCREEILDKLIDGLEPKQVFESVVESVESDTEEKLAA